MRIAVIGFGFSGLMTTANLVREANAPSIVYVIDPSLDAHGLAFGTLNPDHLLNVPAGRMSAWPDVPDDFTRWLASAEGRAAIAARGLKRDYAATDFVPRMLFGDYLTAIWKRTQELAVQKGLELKLVPALGTRIGHETKGLSVYTDRNDAIAADKAVVATGHENKLVSLPIDARFVVQNPWHKGMLTDAAAGGGPVVLLGTGLTAIDMIFSLRRAAYAGPIIAISRRGLLPQSHQPLREDFAFDEKAVLANRSLAELARFVRHAIAQHEKDGGNWREVIDALRPYTQRLWMRLPVAEQRRFLRHLLGYWNIHRHRMAPEVAAKLNEEIKSGKLRIMACRKLNASMEGGRAKLSIATGSGSEKVVYPDALINCIGPELRIEYSTHNLLKQLLADRMAESAPVGIGLAADPHGRIFGEAYPNIYSIGALLTGVLFESTAVPELRVQAQHIAQQLLAV